MTAKMDTSSSSEGIAVQELHFLTGGVYHPALVDAHEPHSEVELVLQPVSTRQ
jgi:hypothetical protein